MSAERMRILELAIESLPSGAPVADIVGAAQAFDAFVHGPEHVVTVNHARADAPTFSDLQKRYREQAAADPAPMPASKVAEAIKKNGVAAVVESAPPNDKPPKGKPHNSNQTRFAAKPMADPATLRRANSSAAVEGRTMFPSTVVDPKDSPALLVGGHNNLKLGKMVMKGPWKGMPLYHLTLEERATCPSDCAVWNDCYGNAMGQARRHSTKELTAFLEQEIQTKAQEHPEGFVVRLHTLGDFFSVQYVVFWEMVLDLYPALHVFGYTARKRDSDIGKRIKALTDLRWGRFAIRFSDAEPKAQGTTVIDRIPEGSQVAEGTVCPAETGQTQCCATCGLCWSPSNRTKPIVFVKHGVVIDHDPAVPARVKAEKPKPDPKPRRDLTEKQVAAYRAIEARIASGRPFQQTDIAADMGISKGALQQLSLALTRNGYLSVKRQAPVKPAIYTLLKTVDGVPTEPPPGSVPAPTHKGRTTNTVVAPVDKHLVRPARPVGLSARPSEKQAPPAYDESMVRRFEGKSRDVMVREALEGQGYEIKSAGSDNWGKSGFLIDGKKVDATKAIEMADEIRASKGLEPIGKVGAA